MKLVSFPHYTCGGLLCDMLNDTFSSVGNNGGIQSIEHGVGKIGDSPDVMEEFDSETFLKHLRMHRTQQWIGTHCWLGNVDLGQIEQVINVTTETYRSRLYRWIRAYHLYYIKSDPWQGLRGIDEIDKQRETAKNYLRAFRRIHDAAVINLEFADVVEANTNLFNLVGRDISHHLERWQKINAFLYRQDLWSSPAVRRFHEAEHELALQQRYVYE